MPATWTSRAMGGDNMRRGITGACLVAVMAICAIGGSSASAALSPPEYGRCKAQANGNFYNNGCTKTTMPGKGKYEWFPAREKGELTLPKPGFTLALKPNTTAKFRTQFGETIVCTSVEGTGDVFLGSPAH